MHELRAASCELQSASCELRAPLNSKVRGVSYLHPELRPELRAHSPRALLPRDSARPEADVGRGSMWGIPEKLELAGVAGVPVFPDRHAAWLSQKSERGLMDGLTEHLCL